MSQSIRSYIKCYMWLSQSTIQEQDLSIYVLYIKVILHQQSRSMCPIVCLVVQWGWVLSLHVGSLTMMERSLNVCCAGLNYICLLVYGELSVVVRLKPTHLKMHGIIMQFPLCTVYHTWSFQFNEVHFWSYIHLTIAQVENFLSAVTLVMPVPISMWREV